MCFLNELRRKDSNYLFTNVILTVLLTLFLCKRFVNREKITNFVHK